MGDYLNNLLAEAFTSEHKAQYIDRSDLGAFGVCPHQGQLRKEHPEAGETNDPLPVTGSIVHTITKEAINACDFRLQEAADYIEQELPKALGRLDLQPDVIRAGKYLAQRMRYNAIYQVMLCENQITRSLIPASKHSGEVLVTTAPDLVLATRDQNTIIVLDYKTGWRKRTKAEARDDFQTCVICWCLFGKYPVETIHFYYIETRRGSYVDVYIQRSEEDNLQARIMEAVRLWQEGCNDAWPSEAKCAICPVIKWCTLAEDACKDLDGEPQLFVDNLIVEQAVIDRKHDLLKKAAKGGRVFYSSDGKSWFDTAPKRKSAERLSLKSAKKTGRDSDNEK